MNQKIVEAIKERAGGLCEVCKSSGDFRGLAIHHKKFRSHGGENDLDNLEYLCGRCHSAKHGIKEVLSGQ